MRTRAAVLLSRAAVLLSQACAGLADLAAVVMPEPEQLELRCRCGYLKRKTTVLIPAHRCPSCGAVLK